MSFKLAVIEALLQYGTPGRDDDGDRTLELSETSAKRPTAYANRRANQIEASLSEQDMGDIVIPYGTIEYFGNGVTKATLDVRSKSGKEI